MKKLISVVMTLLLLCGTLAVLPVSAENKLVFLPKLSETGHTDGGWWANDVFKCAANGDEGMTMTGYYRAIWVFMDHVVEKMPYLIMEVESGLENLTQVTGTHNFLGGKFEKDIDLSGLSSGTVCINLLDFLAGTESPYAATYIAFYIGEEREVKDDAVDKTVSFSKLYLSNTDLDGNVYTPPTQPIPMWNNGGKLIRYDLPAYHDGDHTAPVEGVEGNYGWLMVQGDGTIPVKITDHEDGKGFTMERQEGFEDWQAANIAWVVPYDQLKKTPYLIVDVANEGRTNEGPRVDIYAYWEGVVGSLARFDGIESYTGANGLNGVNAFNLKYAVDNVSEDLHGENGIAIIVALDWSAESSDGTCMDPLKLNDVYLAGFEGGTDGTESFAEHYNHPTQATTTVAGGNAEGGDFPILPVAIAVVAVVVIAGVVVVIKKKK